MKRESPRRLLFEQLEQKRSPTSLLLAVATLDEEHQEAVEAWFESSMSHRQAAAVWNFHHSTEQLLQFVEDHTESEKREIPAIPGPTPEMSEAADVWMRLEDRSARDVVIAESPLWIPRP